MLGDTQKKPEYSCGVFSVLGELTFVTQHAQARKLMVAWSLFAGSQIAAQSRVQLIT